MANESHREPPSVTAGFEKAGLAVAKRHVFLCAGPDCCGTDEGLATWDTLKFLLKSQGIPAMRTKAACLRICSRGPWMVVYPDGIWYGAVTPERCKRIVAEHLLGGRPVAEWIVRNHPLGGAPGKLP